MAIVLPTLSLRLKLSRTRVSLPSYWNVTRSKVMSWVMRGRSGATGLLADIVVPHREPAERSALQAEGLDHCLRGDVLLHHAEKCRFIELLIVVRLHCLRRQNPRADQRDREHQQRHRGELPVQEQHQNDARDQFQERQGGAVGKTLDRSLEGRKVDGKTRENFTALGARKISRRQILDVLE